MFSSSRYISECLVRLFVAKMEVFFDRENLRSKCDVAEKEWRYAWVLLPACYIAGSHPGTQSFFPEKNLKFACFGEIWFFSYIIKKCFKIFFVLRIYLDKEFLQKRNDLKLFKKNSNSHPRSVFCPERHLSLELDLAAIYLFIPSLEGACLLLPFFYAFKSLSFNSWSFKIINK